LCLFALLSGLRQIRFALLLPLIKRDVKNAINSLFRDQHDLKPNMVVLNADIYHVLFVSWCMNGAKTPLHTVLKLPQPDKTASRWTAVVPIDTVVSTGAHIRFWIWQMQSGSMTSPMQVPTSTCSDFLLLELRFRDDSVLLQCSTIVKASGTEERTTRTMQ